MRRSWTSYASRTGARGSAGKDRQKPCMLAEGREVVCITDGTDRYRRILAECWVGEPSMIAGTSLNAAMVRQGWALDYTKYPKGRHATEQLQAEIDGVGIWSSAFIPPETWRRAKRSGTTSAGSG
jgi:endonuclease YncB( thermonuclease family)